MRLSDLFEARSPIADLSDYERHELLDFVGAWYYGRYMGGNEDPHHVMKMWEKVHTLFPPKVSGPVTLYRLVTVPIENLNRSPLNFRPAPGKVSSWASNLKALDQVNDMAGEMGRAAADTCRIAIAAAIPAENIIATVSSLRKAILSLSSGYLERYPSTIEVVPYVDAVTGGSGQKSVVHSHPDFPKGDWFCMDEIDEVGYLQAHARDNRGGYHNQYECIVRTPRRVVARNMGSYRAADKTTMRLKR